MESAVWHRAVSRHRVGLGDPRLRVCAADVPLERVGQRLGGPAVRLSLRPGTPGSWLWPGHRRIFPPGASGSLPAYLRLRQDFARSHALAGVHLDSFRQFHPSPACPGLPGVSWSHSSVDERSTRGNRICHAGRHLPLRRKLRLESAVLPHLQVSGKWLPENSCRLSPSATICTPFATAFEP